MTDHTDAKTGQTTRPPQDLELERTSAAAVERERSSEKGASAGGASAAASTGTDSVGGASDASGDRDAIIELLNSDLRTEYQSILQYILHATTLKGAEYASTIIELKGHLSQELSHALVLAEQIDFLGGTPSVEVPPVAAETETIAALRSDLDLENMQLVRYRERVQQAQDAGLPDVAEALRPLLEQTQEHVRDLRSALGV
jgi:bacterioferritin